MATYSQSECIDRLGAWVKDRNEHSNERQMIMKVIGDLNLVFNDKLILRQFEQIHLVPVQVEVRDHDLVRITAPVLQQMEYDLISEFHG